MEMQTQNIVGSEIFFTLLSFLAFVLLLYTLYRNYKVFKHIAEEDDCSAQTRREAAFLSRRNFWLFVFEFFPVVFALVVTVGLVVFASRNETEHYTD
jgi:hypothetical protein